MRYADFAILTKQNQ